MAKVYTTEELIEILDSEHQACLRGERLNLSATPYIGNTAVDRWLNPDAMQRFAAYQDFKSAVHRYQQEHDVSGIVWRSLTLHGETLHYPQVHDRLIALDRDLDSLRRAKPETIAFWERSTASMDLYLSVNQGKDYQRISPEDVRQIDRRTEWANLWKWENDSFLEVVLQLGWGQGHEAAYRRGSLVSGSEYIHGVRSGHLPIG
ncbi:hypothetical protein [Baaleninema sp.]|uniref:hypothetical protein n=1 Tax=Baaleninema sp. TaxID=3101197 RepID=UPI003D066153